MFSLPDDLYSFQKEDLDRLLSSESNFLNLSEMGTGKTPVAIGLAALGGFRSILVVCPKTLQLEWSRQIEDWCGFKPAVSHRGSSRRLEPLFYDLLGKGTPNPFFIVNYDTFGVKRHLEILEHYPFDLVILDEGHRLRNPRTAQTRGMFRFLEAHSNSRLLILTGSPIVNNPADLHTLLCMVRPTEYSRRQRMSFIQVYCYYYPTRYGLKIYGVKNMEELRQETSPFTVRRTKKEVLPFFPEKYYRKPLLEMDKEQRDAYTQMEEDLFVLLDDGEPLWAPSVLAQLTRLRQLSLEPRILGIDRPSAKTDFLLDLLEDMNGSKLVIYSCFEKYIQYLHHILPQKHILITGAVPVDDRIKNVQLFQEDSSVQLALGTTQCMGEGLTLTAASDVVIMDRWWSPAVQAQAEDRLHRIGQKNAVQVIVPTVIDSIDQSLDKILESKKKFSSEYLGDKDVMREVVDDLRISRRR